jgi:hypothetical protein
MKQLAHVCLNRFIAFANGRIDGWSGATSARWLDRRRLWVPTLSTKCGERMGHAGCILDGPGLDLDPTKIALEFDPN